MWTPKMPLFYVQSSKFMFHKEKKKFFINDKIANPQKAHENPKD